MGVVVGVSCGDDHGDIRARQGGDCVINRLGSAAPEAHVDDGITAAVIGPDPVHACDHVRCVPRAVTVENSHPGYVRRLCYAICAADGCASNVRSMPITVRRIAVVVHKVVARHHAACVFGVRRPNAGIDHVHRHPGTIARRSEAVVQWQGALIDAI